jgi:hypothetical protein
MALSIIRPQKKRGSQQTNKAKKQRGCFRDSYCRLIYNEKIPTFFAGQRLFVKPFPIARIHCRLRSPLSHSSDSSSNFCGTILSLILSIYVRIFAFSESQPFLGHDDGSQ